METSGIFAGNGFGVMKRESKHMGIFTKMGAKVTTKSSQRGGAKSPGSMCELVADL
jgi:hypothetical protein